MYKKKRQLTSKSWVTYILFHWELISIETIVNGSLPPCIFCVPGTTAAIPFRFNNTRVWHMPLLYECHINHRWGRVLPLVRSHKLCQPLIAHVLLGINTVLHTNAIETNRAIGAGIWEPCSKYWRALHNAFHFLRCDGSYVKRLFYGPRQQCARG